MTLSTTFITWERSWWTLYVKLESVDDSFHNSYHMKTIYSNMILQAQSLSELGHQDGVCLD